MSLRNLDHEEELDDIVISKKKFKLFKLPKNTNIILIAVIIGCIIGLLTSHYFIEPTLNELKSNTQLQCFATRDALSKENECLYNYITDAKLAINGCKI
jgi:hypothetical protein